MTPAIQEIIDTQGWDEASVLSILWSYVENQRQEDAVLDHFIEAQKMENREGDDPQLSLLADAPGPAE